MREKKKNKNMFTDSVEKYKHSQNGQQPLGRTFTVLNFTSNDNIYYFTNSKQDYKIVTSKKRVYGILNFK